jgi:hypothetical protein
MHTYHTILCPALIYSPYPHLKPTRCLFNLAYPKRQHSISPKPLPSTQPYLCLCFGFLLQIIYTYRPFFLLTLLHPSHIFLTELRTFMPRVCGAVCRRRPLKRAVRSASGCCVRAARRLGRKSVLQAHVGVWMWRARGARREVGKRVRRSGRRRDRGSILGGLRFVGAGGVGSWW